MFSISESSLGGFTYSSLNLDIFSTTLSEPAKSADRFNAIGNGLPVNIPRAYGNPFFTAFLPNLI